MYVNKEVENVKILNAEQNFQKKTSQRDGQHIEE